MTTFLHWNSQAYNKLLIVFRRELRREFGMEMTLVFAEDLSDAWRKRGALGMIQVWWRAFAEVVSIALPDQCANSRVTVPVIAFGLSVAVRSAVTGFAIRHAPATGLQGTLLLGETIRFFVLLPGLADAAVAFAVACLSKSKPPISLLLAYAHREAHSQGNDHA
jgi:hypothetical protein